MGQSTLLPGIRALARPTQPLPTIKCCRCRELRAAGRSPVKLPPKGAAPSPAWGSRNGRGSLAELSAVTPAGYHLFLH